MCMVTVQNDLLPTQYFRSHLISRSRLRSIILRLVKTNITCQIIATLACVIICDDNKTSPGIDLSSLEAIFKLYDMQFYYLSTDSVFEL